MKVIILFISKYPQNTNKPSTHCFHLTITDKKVQTFLKQNRIFAMYENNRLNKFFE